MKKTVYTKAGQVGLVEVERPRIEAPDDVILRIVRTCRLWIRSMELPQSQIFEAGHQNSGHEAIGIVEELVSPLQRLSQETLSSRLSPMVVGSVMPVVLVMMGLVTAILAPTGLTGCKQSTSVSTLLIGPLSRFQGNRLIIQKPCFKSLLTFSRRYADRLPCSACG